MCAVLAATPNWFDSHQYVALWIEGGALFAIFFLDWWEYRKQGRERLKQEQDRIEQHKETAEQMGIPMKAISIPL